MKTNTNTNGIPPSLLAAITLGRNVYAGALSVGLATELQQNTAVKIGIDLHDLIGNPATPLVPGKQARYAAQLVAVKDAFAAKRAAISAGREFCRLAINLLRPVLGNEWNTAWHAAGFHTPSLALPAQPAAMLGALRSYFNEHPAHENEPANITAADAEAAVTAIDSAILAVGAAKNARVVRKAERDAALKTLRARMSGVRAELDQLLEDDDGRWYEFGFRRPIDGTQPPPVLSVTLTPGGAGIVLVSWPASSYADNYRLTWKPTSSSDPATEAGLVAGTQYTLTGLPSGVPVTVGVSARNDSGESAVKEAAITVP